jgi:predicted nucleotidyltransferase
MAAGKDIIGRVQKFTLQLLAIGIPLDKVILFGSKANGTASEESDVDVSLISGI